MRPRLSAPMVSELYWPTLPARSTMVRVAAVQAKLEQWATLRLPLVSSKELMRPRPSVPMVTELYWPTSSSLWRVVRVAAVQAKSEQWATLRSPSVEAWQLGRQKPSAPIIIEDGAPTSLAAPSRVVRVAAVQAESEQWATLRSPLVAS